MWFSQISISADQYLAVAFDYYAAVGGLAAEDGERVCR